VILRLCTEDELWFIEQLFYNYSTDNILCLVYPTRQCVAPPRHNRQANSARHSKWEASDFHRWTVSAQSP